MSGLYGSWLVSDYNYDETYERINNLHGHFYPKYEKRVSAINKIAILSVDDITPRFPELDGKINICFSNILALVGRYFNDIAHYKVWHEISDTEIGKMVSHLVKWAFFFPPLSVTLSEDEWKKLSKPAKKIALNINLYFIDQLIKYVLQGFSITDVSTEKYRKIFYLLETAQYDAKNVTLLFDEII